MPPDVALDSRRQGKREGDELAAIEKSYARRAERIKAIITEKEKAKSVSTFEQGVCVCVKGEGGRGRRAREGGWGGEGRQGGNPKQGVCGGR